jgi:hypothetical protein
MGAEDADSTTARLRDPVAAGGRGSGLCACRRRAARLGDSRVRWWVRAAEVSPPGLRRAFTTSEGWIMKFIGGCRHGMEVPQWARDGRSSITVAAPGETKVPQDECEYRLAIWRHADGSSEFFFCCRALRDEVEIDAAARPLLARSRGTASQWQDLFGS